MADLIISPELAEKITQIARRHNQPVETVLADMIERYEALNDLAPGSTLRDEDIDVPSDIQNAAEYRAQIRAMRPLLYEKARNYWTKKGDQARLALANAELDKQFWCIDPDGIPRLKLDRDQVQLPPDPLEGFVNLFANSEITDASTTTRETLTTYYQKRHARSD